MNPLIRVKRATVKRRAAESEWRAAIRAAVGEGQTHRSVADAAGVTHTRVQQILRDQ